MKKDKIYIYGRHALKEALMNSPQSVKKVFLANRKDSELEILLKNNRIPIGDLSAASSKDEASHQGIIASIDPEKILIDYDEFFKTYEVNDKSLFVILDGLQDPQNVGAIIRSAVAFGASGVLMPKTGQVSLTGAVAKASAGMLFNVPIITVGDIVTKMVDLKKRGFIIYGMDAHSSTDLLVETFEGPTIFIMGNESNGLGDNTKKQCDKLISIPMDSRCESLNVAVSAGILLYKMSRVDRVV